MTILQTYQLWIGFGFVALLVIFLIVAFFGKDKIGSAQVQILRFLCSLCAGFAGALITGEALFKMNLTTGSNGTIAIQGAAGAALFFAVWFTFKLVVPPPDAYNVSIPDGWKFNDTVKTLVKRDGAVADFIGFTQEELEAPLRGQELHTKTLIDSLRALRLLSTATPIREYQIEFQAPTYRLRIG